MASFSVIITGNDIVANDVDQLINALNGTVSTQLILVNTSATPPLITQLSAAPASDTAVIQTSIQGDTDARISTYIRSSDGYGGVSGGAGTSITAHLYAQSTGWYIPESLTVAGSITVNGSINATISGNATSAQALSGGSVTTGTNSLSGVAQITNTAGTTIYFSSGGVLEDNLNYPYVTFANNAAGVGHRIWVATSLPASGAIDGDLAFIY